MPKKMMVVDDEDSIVKLITYNLEKAGFMTVSVNDGLEVIRKLELERPDLIILDLMLPYLDGFEICQNLRRKGNETPIIMVSARDSETDKVIGLELGADDYITKPFSPRELVSRVKAVLKRTEMVRQNPADSEILTAGSIQMDLVKHEVLVGGQMVELTGREFDLLYFLMKKKGQVISREDLLDQVWNFEAAVGTRVVDVYISNLRNKIEKEPQNPNYIKTVRGYGYCLRPIKSESG